MDRPRATSFNYAIGFFGMSIPINMLKTFAFTFYVLDRGVTTTQWGAMMLISFAFSWFINFEKPAEHPRGVLEY